MVKVIHKTTKYGLDVDENRIARADEPAKKKRGK